jgi:hypothetical protein
MGGPQFLSGNLLSSLMSVCPASLGRDSSCNRLSGQPGQPQHSGFG